MQERFIERVHDSAVAHDLGVLAHFVGIYCDGHHRDRDRAPFVTDGSTQGVYARRYHLCAECTAHLAYAEKRRAYCSHDPKPYCAHCPTQCYRAEEQEWQRTMMRYSGQRSWYRGHLRDGVRHMVEGMRWQRDMTRQARSAAASGEDQR